MISAISSAESANPGLYTIGTVSELTGVNPITLRAWERRYGLFEPIRKASRHRLYSQDHIDLINRIVGLLDRGMRIGQIKAFLDSEPARGTDRESASDPYWRRTLDRMLAAVARFDEPGLEAAYDEVLAMHPVRTVTKELLIPLLEELGRRWADGKGTVAEEHFFGCYLRNKLGARFHHRLRATSGPKLMLACLPGDRHEMGLLLFALAANDAGYQTVLLGADMPLDDLASAAQGTRCAAIVLSGCIPSDEHELERAIKALVDRSALPVLVGGRLSIDSFDVLKRAGAEPLGVDVDRALARLNERLNRE